MLLPVNRFRHPARWQGPRSVTPSKLSFNTVRAHGVVVGVADGVPVAVAVAVVLLGVSSLGPPLNTNVSIPM